MVFSLVLDTWEGSMNSSLDYDHNYKYLINAILRTTHYINEDSKDYGQILRGINFSLSTIYITITSVLFLSSIIAFLRFDRCGLLIGIENTGHHGGHRNPAENQT